MRRSERYSMYAAHALLRCVLATVMTVGSAALAAIALYNKSVGWTIAGAVFAFVCLICAIVEAKESSRLRRISRGERAEENQRAIRPKTENQTNQ